MLQGGERAPRHHQILIDRGALGKPRPLEERDVRLAGTHRSVENVDALQRSVEKVALLLRKIVFARHQRLDPQPFSPDRRHRPQQDVYGFGSVDMSVTSEKSSYQAV